MLQSSLSAFFLRNDSNKVKKSSVRKGSNELTALKVDDVTRTDDLEIAESMNSYFSTVFTSEDYGNFPEYSNLVDNPLYLLSFLEMILTK